VVSPSKYRMKEVASKVLSMLSPEVRALSGDWSHLVAAERSEEAPTSPISTTTTSSSFPSSPGPAPVIVSEPPASSMTEISERIMKLLAKHDPENPSPRVSSSQDVSNSAADVGPAKALEESPRHRSRPPTISGQGGTSSPEYPSSRPAERTHIDPEVLELLRRQEERQLVPELAETTSELPQSLFDRKLKEHLRREQLLKDQLLKGQLRQQILKAQLEQVTTSGPPSKEQHITQQLTEIVVLEARLKEGLLKEEAIKTDLMLERERMLGTLQ